MGASLFHSAMSIGVLLAAFAFFNGFLYWTVLFIPLVLLPLVMFTLGVAWILASLGVFLRDVGQTMGMLTTALLFLSPVFYPVSALPEQLQGWVKLNPLTPIIEEGRKTLVFGQSPDWPSLIGYLAAGSVVAWVGYWWFQKTRRGFADVV
jgi:lipopolysaccharide transport system permease protein